jgi:hypothetical protein
LTTDAFAIDLLQNRHLHWNHRSSSR